MLKYTRPDMQQLMITDDCFLQIIGTQDAPVPALPVFESGDESVRRKDIKILWNIPKDASIHVIDYKKSLDNPQIWMVYIEFLNTGIVDGESFAGCIVNADSVMVYFSTHSITKTLSDALRDNHTFLLPR